MYNNSYFPNPSKDTRFIGPLLPFIGGALVGYDELLHTANALTARTFETVYFVYGLAMAFAVLAAVNIPRMILKEKMR